VCVVRSPGSRGGVAERHGGDDAGGLVDGHSALRGVLDAVVLVVQTDGAVGGLHAGGHGGAGRCGVGDGTGVHVVVIVPCLDRIVGPTVLVGGHGQLVEVLVGLDRVTRQLLKGLSIGLALNLVLGLAGLEQVGGSNMVVPHAV